MQTSRRNQNEKEWQYRSIFDAANDGVIIHDLETGCVVEANPAACLMLGYPREEFIGLSLTAFIHPDSQNLFSEYIRAFQSDAVFRFADIARTPGWLNVLCRMARDSVHFSRPPVPAGYCIRDVSKRIQAEQLLHQRVETSTHEQAKLLEISQTLASTLEFQPGMILDQLREIVEFTHGGLFTLEDSAVGRPGDAWDAAVGTIRANPNPRAGS